MEDQTAKIWKDLSDEELELQYMCSVWSHRMSPKEVLQSHVKTLQEESVKAISLLSHELHSPYGISERQKINIFGADCLSSDAPIFVYIHGGYWQDLSFDVSNFMAVPLVKAGAVVVSVGYDLAPQANMDEIVSQVKNAIRFIISFTKKRKSRSGVYICGHSAGGHLTAMMAAVNWAEEGSPNIIKGFIPVSGVFDVRPLVRTSVNEPLKMDVETAWRNSPLRLVDDIIKYCAHLTFLVVVAQHDSPQFHLQNDVFVKALKDGGLPVQNIVVENTDHFNVIEQLTDRNYIVTQEIIKMMGLLSTQ